MPNKPATPARTFRLSNEAIESLDRATEVLNLAGRSDAVRKAIERLAAALCDTSDVPLDALAAADEAAWFDVHMPREEANRRLIAALQAARPYLVAAERRRVLEDVAERLRGFHADPAVITHFANLADAVLTAPYRAVP